MLLNINYRFHKGRLFRDEIRGSFEDMSECEIAIMTLLTNMPASGVIKLYDPTDTRPHNETDNTHSRDDSIN